MGRGAIDHKSGKMHRLDHRGCGLLLVLLMKNIRLSMSAIERRVAIDRYPVHGAGLRKIIRDCPVLSTAIIPKRNGVDPPLETHMKLRRFHMLR